MYSVNDAPLCHLLARLHGGGLQPRAACWRQCHAQHDQTWSSCLPQVPACGSGLPGPRELQLWCSFQLWPHRGMRPFPGQWSELLCSLKVLTRPQDKGRKQSKRHVGRPESPGRSLLHQAPHDLRPGLPLKPDNGLIQATRAPVLGAGACRQCVG